MKSDKVKVGDKEVDAARLLAALHNNTRSIGMGALHDIGRKLTVEEARADLAEVNKFRFDYYRGRPLKTSVKFDDETTLDVESSRRLYDRDAGAGQFDKALAEATE